MKTFTLALPALLAMNALANPLPGPNPNLVIETTIHDDGQPVKVVSNFVAKTDVHGTQLPFLIPISFRHNSMRHLLRLLFNFASSSE